MNIKFICGRNIREYRRKLGLTQADLARITGISNSAIAHYEIYENFPSSECLVWLAEALQIKPYQLLMELEE